MIFESLASDDIWSCLSQKGDFSESLQLVAIYGLIIAIVLSGQIEVMEILRSAEF